MYYKWFYYKNALQTTLLYESIANGFITGKHCKWFYYKEALQMILL